MQTALARDEAGTGAAPRRLPRREPTGDARVRGHLPALDGVRGLAILAVLLLHFVGNQEPRTALERAVGVILGYGAYGVDLFFVLSGFLITGILYETHASERYFRSFYVRRVLRIFPLYYGVLVALFLAAPLIPAVRGPSLEALREHQGWVWLYGVNVFDALQGRWAMPYIDHFWSLAVEEHFYLVWPLVVWALAPRPRLLVRVSLGLALAAMLARVAASAAGANEVAIYVLTPFRLDALCLGAFLAVSARQPGGLDALAARARPAALAAGTLLVASFAFNRLTPVGFELLRPLRTSLITVLLAAVVVRAVTAPAESRVGRAFRSAPLVQLGKYSYGLYVFHHFASFWLTRHGTADVLARWTGSHLGAVLVQAAAGIALSFGAAVASFELFEKRFLSLKRWWSA